MEISEIFKKLEQKGLTFGSIESMTGGLFATTITNVSGASKVYKGSIITYTSEEKINIVGVNKETIDKETVVIPVYWFGVLLATISWRFES